MPDFRVADTASEHPKMRAAGLAAFGLWTAGGSYAMNPAHMTDGWVPLHYVQTWPSGKRLAAKLIEVGLWREEKRNGMPGYRFHEWEEIQRSASSVEDEKRKARDRMARFRSGHVRPNGTRTAGERSPERSPNVHDSLTLTLTQSLTPGEGFRGERSVSEREVAKRPPERCPKHANDPDPPNCGACADARRAATAWDRDATRRAAEARSADARQRAETRQRAVDACGMCDEHGYDGRRVCDHDPDAADRHDRGRTAARAALTPTPPERP